MKTTAGDIARYFLATQDADDPMNNLKLQKLCYFAQGFALALWNRPLFGDDLIVWENGPVVPGLFDAYRQHGPLGIPQLERTEHDAAGIDPETSSLLDEVAAVYGQYSGWRLRELTDCEPPCQQARRRADRRVDPDEMRAHFQTLLVRDRAEN